MFLPLYVSTTTVLIAAAIISNSDSSTKYPFSLKLYKSVIDKTMVSLITSTGLSSPSFSLRHNNNLDSRSLC